MPSTVRLALAACTVIPGWTFPASAQVTFVDVSVARGILPQVNEDGIGAGVAVADYDGDGFADIFLPQAAGTPDRLYHNLGNGSFQEVGQAAGVAYMGTSRVALWLDYDGDGDLDLFVANDDTGASSSFRFYRQTSPGLFQEYTAPAGLNKAPIVVDARHHWGGISAGDIDNDGDLDLFTVQWPGPGHLFRNLGAGAFEDISAHSNIGAYSAFMHQPLMNDFNDDGLVDIYVAVDEAPNRLWINLGNSKFANEAPAAGLDNHMNDMGMAFGDYDNDGDFDVYITNIWYDDQHFLGPRWNVLYRNDSAGGQPSFTDVAQDSAVDYGYWGWGATFLDVDNDGDLDLAATNGWREAPFTDDPSRFFVNPGSGSAFVDASNTVGFNDTNWGSSLVSFDFDRDGDLDLLQLCFNGHLRLLENQPAGPIGNYLVVQPRMPGGPNTRAIGAVVRATVGGTTMTRWITAGTSYLGQEPAEAFFGLGSATAVDSLTVEWPAGGGETSLLNVAANQVLIVEPGDSSVPATSTWGALVMALLVVSGGTVLQVRRKSAGASRAVGN